MQDRSPRFKLKLQIVYDDGSAFMSGAVVDISETGVFIETVMPLEPGTEVRLMPLVPDEAGILDITGTVVRKFDYDLDNHFDRTPGMGVRFRDVTPDARANLVEMLTKYGHEVKQD